MTREYVLLGAGGFSTVLRTWQRGTSIRFVHHRLTCPPILCGRIRDGDHVRNQRGGMGVGVRPVIWVATGLDVFCTIQYIFGTLYVCIEHKTLRSCRSRSRVHVKHELSKRIVSSVLQKTSLSLVNSYRCRYFY